MIRNSNKTANVINHVNRFQFEGDDDKREEKGSLRRLIETTIIHMGKIFVQIV